MGKMKCIMIVFIFIMMCVIINHKYRVKYKKIIKKQSLEIELLKRELEEIECEEFYKEGGF
jgi:hypothetical protein